MVLLKRQTVLFRRNAQVSRSIRRIKHMTLLLVGIVLTILMVFITRQLTSSLPPERFRSVIRLLLPAYLLLNLYFTLLMREPSEDRLVTLVPLRSYFAVLGWDIQSFSAVGRYCQELCANTTASLMKLVRRRPNRPRACSA